jgi:hypothetical protein
MKTLEYHPDRIDYYKSNDFSAIDGSSAMEDAIVQPHSEADGKPLDKESCNQEREQQLEAWMTNIKAFIRSIDITKL